MSRFFHTLVVVGAAISAAACGGQSESHPGGEGATGGSGGSGGTGAGGDSASGGSAASSGSGDGARGGSSGTSGTGTGGSGGSILPITGGTSGVGGNGGTSGTAAAGTGGMSTTGPFPEPELPTSQWNCRHSFVSRDCVETLGVTAHQLSEDCPIDETLPKSADYCATDEIYTCVLAVTVSGEPVLVNCDCWQYSIGYPCVGCSSLDLYNGAPVSCEPSLKICECAYTGILR